VSRKKNPRTALGIKWGEGSITQRGDRWQARWPETALDGKVRWPAKSFATQDEAVEHLREVARAKRERRYVARTQLTVSAMVVDYLERGKLRWTTNTYITYRGIAERHIDPTIGRANAQELKVADVQRWVDTHARTGRIGPSIIASALLIVSGAFKDAVRFDLVTTNPTIGVSPPPRERTEMLTWTASEARKVLTDPDGSIQMLTLYQVALTTGMRPGEVRALQWRDIDLDRGVANIRRSMTRDEGFRSTLGTDTKTLGSRRTVALTPATVHALRRQLADQQERRQQRRQWEDLDMVFDNGHGRWLSQQSWGRYHDAMCERLGITRIRLHDTRHTAATLLLERNVHPKVVADLLGHSSVTMTLDRYSHVSDSLQRSAVDALDMHLRSDD
jgi:integrase